ncbi:hypothetical protein ACIG87_21540, partial [Micromonospora sp. NPDC051925]|uniref:hypothetical protein n=1 Tax=Micromonospora sp. NPDC051925 TaxID=3364288 RepID=UPI0037CC386C
HGTLDKPYFPRSEGTSSFSAQSVGSPYRRAEVNARRLLHLVEIETIDALSRDDTRERSRGDQQR